MLSNKPGISNLVTICAEKGIKTVVISPGSRNAPLIISFSEHGGFDCLSIPDERVAAFFALGIAQQTRIPVIITCTSGTASLNFAPAIAEAFYQKIPLLVLTADRPVEWIGQGEGQSIRQKQVYANYVKRSYELPQEPETHDDLWSNDRIICEAIDQTTLGVPGPVHINVPLREPLYGRKENISPTFPKIIRTMPVDKSILSVQLRDLTSEWTRTNKKMILCGLSPMVPDTKGGHTQLNEQLARLNADNTVVIFSEVTSNVFTKSSISNFDSLLSAPEIVSGNQKKYSPDLLITLGDSFISKKIKNWIRSNRPPVHWHIGTDNYYLDTFQSLTRSIPLSPHVFFKQWLSFLDDTRQDLSASTITDSFRENWTRLKKFVRIKQRDYLQGIGWSDLRAFHVLLPQLPENTNLHLANSTPIRYAQLFEPRRDITYNANRGVAGIDGSSSTAAGAAFVTGRATTLITGDLSFFYDSNALWHRYLTPLFRIVLINNEGGNIFRFISGPDTTNQLSEFFEAGQQADAEFIARAFKLNYFVADNEEVLKKVIPEFFQMQPNNRPALLEIKTPGIESAKIWRDYFAFLKET